MIDDECWLNCIGTYSVFATKVLYNEASESGATAHASIPILVTPAEIVSDIHE